MKYWSALVAALCLATSAPSFAGPRVCTGDVTEHNVQMLTSEIQWHTNLPQAEYMARQQGKMVFWMHMLGNLSGAT
ncbi:MAG TPA: hypothetical protein V6C76_15320 [Drouetiella sp.]